MAIDQQFKELRDFTDLTSDKVIREAAYPLQEWLENGGNNANGFFGNLNSYSIVSMQDEPPEIRPQGGLLSLNKLDPVRQDSIQRAKNVASHWEKVQSHAYYKMLNNDVNFTSAWNKFQNKTKVKSASKGYKSEFANFHFYNLIALHIGFQLISDEVGYKPKYPTAKVLNQARGHIEKLQDYFKNDGLKLNDFLAQLQLESHLKQLALEIEQAPRKDKETPTAPKRRCLEGFAVACIYAFDEASSTILSNLAGVLGWGDCHSSTIGEIVIFAKDKVQKERNKALVEAIKNPRPK
jgi:hypothetical protein